MESSTQFARCNEASNKDAIDDNDNSTEYPDLEESSDDGFELGLDPVNDDEGREESSEEKSARQQQEKMELFWKLIDLGFSREITSKAIYEKEFTDIYTATEYVLSSGKLNQGGPNAFDLENIAPKDHKFYDNSFSPVDPQKFNKAVEREINSLKSSLPEGIYVRGFKDRTDLYRVMIKGLKDTPYEDGLFFYDIQLPADFPATPPRVYYIDYAKQTETWLNLKLYFRSKVCLSILGTWSEEKCANWNSKDSSLFQVLVAIQGLFSVTEPYFNHPGHMIETIWKFLDPPRSKKYNEDTIVEVLKSAIGQVQCPPEPFQGNVQEHFAETSHKLIKRLEAWVDVKTEKDLEIEMINEMGNITNSEIEMINKMGNITISMENKVIGSYDSAATKTNYNEMAVLSKLRGLVAAEFPPPKFPLLPVSDATRSQVIQCIGQLENVVQMPYI